MTELELIVKNLDKIGTELYNKFGADSYVIRCELHDIKDQLKAINYTHCCKSDSEQLVCDDNELDCPYEFTSRCTMGRCDCKPKAN